LRGPHLGFEHGVRDAPGGGVQLIDALSTAIAIYAGCVALVAAGCFALRRPRPAFLDKLVLVLEGALIVRAMLGVGAMVSHAHAYPGATHVAYLVTSVAILPVTMAFVTEDRSHWSAAVVVVACLALVVIAVRVQMTWSGHV
jgi:heme A synthase